MELNARDGSQTPYDVWVTINGNEIGRIKKDVLFTNYEFAINSSNLRYSIAGSAPNRYFINDTMPHQYLTIISNVKVVMCLDKLKLFICAENPQQAESIAGRIPWIYQPSRRLNVSILQPENGANLTFGADTTIKARVMGNGIGEKYTTVIARFNNSKTIRTLVNNGEYEEGVYATNWIPDAYGPCTITVTASNCATIGSAKSSAMVPNRIPGTSLFVRKDLVPATLETNNIDTVNGSRMKYTISLIPISGTTLTDVTVKDNIPNYCQRRFRSAQYRRDNSAQPYKYLCSSINADA
jgi:hypothetical protein